MATKKIFSIRVSDQDVYKNWPKLTRIERKKDQYVYANYYTRIDAKIWVVVIHVLRFLHVLMPKK